MKASVAARSARQQGASALLCGNWNKRCPLGLWHAGPALKTRAPDLAVGALRNASALPKIGKGDEADNPASIAHSLGNKKTDSWATRLLGNLMLAFLVGPALLWGGAFPGTAHAKRAPEPASTATVAPSTSSMAGATAAPQQTAVQAAQGLMASPQYQLAAGVLATLLVVVAVSKTRPATATAVPASPPAAASADASRVLAAAAASVAPVPEAVHAASPSPAPPPPAATATAAASPPAAPAPAPARAVSAAYTSATPATLSPAAAAAPHNTASGVSAPTDSLTPTAPLAPVAVPAHASHEAMAPAPADTAAPAPPAVIAVSEMRSAPAASAAHNGNGGHASPEPTPLAAATAAAPSPSAAPAVMPVAAAVSHAAVALPAKEEKDAVQPGASPAPQSPPPPTPSIPPATVAAASGNAASSAPPAPARKVEPGVLALGVATAAALALAPAGKFVVSDLLPSLFGSKPSNPTLADRRAATPGPPATDAAQAAPEGAQLVSWASETESVARPESPGPAPALSDAPLQTSSGSRAKNIVMAATVTDAADAAAAAAAAAGDAGALAACALGVSNIVAFNLARAASNSGSAKSASPPAADIAAGGTAPPAELPENVVLMSGTVHHNLAIAAKDEILQQLQQQASTSTAAAAQQVPHGHAVEDAVHKWTDMVRASPAAAIEAVSEARALADAVISDVDAANGLSPLAAATAAALAAPRPEQRGWMWAWAWALTTTMTDPVRNLLQAKPPSSISKYDPIRFGTWSAPTTKSRFDPLSSLPEWGPVGVLPAWDPLARLRDLAPRHAADGSPLPRSKYDAIGQLIDFLAELPELVNSTEWAKASAADPVRFLLADVARRPGSSLLAVSHKPWAPPKRRKSKWRKYDPLAGLMDAATAHARWEDVVTDMLQLEAVCGPQVPHFSPIKVMAARDGKAFAEALSDFRRLAVSEPGAQQFAQQFPTICTWLQAASNVSLATCAGGVKLGPVWGLLQLPAHQHTLKNARDALPALMGHLQRKHFSLYSLLRQGDSHQTLTLMAILASWVVEDEMATTGKAPSSLLPPPPPQVTASESTQESRGLFGALRMFTGSQALASFGPFAGASKLFAPATTSRNSD